VNRKLAGLTLLLLLAFTNLSHAQSGEWAWQGGPFGTNDGIPTYGTLGVPSTKNIPAMREGSGTWTDAKGNLWMLGGSGVDSAGVTATLNDLWRCNPASGQWTWMTGNSAVGTNYSGLYGTTSGVYGSQGVAAAGNTTGSRYQGVSWIDASGNLWLFGGSGTDSVGGSGLLNDLWEYSITANTWTWVGDGNTVPPRNTGLYQAAAGVYGTQGTASATNIPGGRFEGVAWTDASGNFWLFGGVGADSTDTDGLLNDVWEYSLSANTWTWMGGSTTVYAPAVYGTEDVASAANTPGARYMMLYWMDATHNLWLFGGGGYTDGDPNAFTYYDLWTTGSAGTTSPSPSVMVGPTGPLSFTSTVNTASASQTLTVTNNGTASLSITGISITGTGAGAFGQTTTCGSTLAVNASCTIALTFTPTTATTYTASLSIADNASNSPQAVTLSGTGTAASTPAVTLAPIGPLSFTSTVNTASAAQSVMVSNTGTASLTITGITITGTGAAAFGKTTTCGSTLAASASCSIALTFTPTTATSYTASLSIADNASNSPQAITLSGTGTAAALATTTTSLSASANTIVAATNRAGACSSSSCSRPHRSARSRSLPAAAALACRPPPTTSPSPQTAGASRSPLRCSSPSGNKGGHDAHPSPNRSRSHVRRSPLRRVDRLSAIRHQRHAYRRSAP
jgi:hypothetical protein